MLATDIVPGAVTGTLNGAKIDTPIYAVAYEATENFVYALTDGGIVYKMNGTTMEVTSTYKFNTDNFMATGVCLVVDDDLNLLFLMTVITTSQTKQNHTLLINTQNMQPISYLWAFDTASRFPSEGDQCFLSKSSQQLFWANYNPTSTLTSFLRLNYGTGGFQKDPTFLYSQLSQAIQAPTGRAYNTDANIFGYLKSVSTLQHQVYSWTPGNTPIKRLLSFSPTYSTSDPLSGDYNQGNFRYTRGPLFGTTNYNYLAFSSAANGSLILQYDFPIPINSDPAVPKSSFYLTEKGMNVVIVDEKVFGNPSDKRVMIIGSKTGVLKKYRIVDSDSGPWTVQTPNYNGDESIDDKNSPLTALDVDVPNKQIYFASYNPLAENGGVWRF